MNRKEHLLKLGKIIANLLGLEFLLRTYLNKYNEATETSADIDNISIGDEVPVNSFTNYDTFGKVIDKYNIIIRTKDSSLVIDKSIVNIRDTIAHGRLYGKTPNPPYRIIKYGKPIEPNKYNVKIENIIEANSEWFHYTITLILEQFNKAKKAWNMLNVTF